MTWSSNKRSRVLHDSFRYPIDALAKLTTMIGTFPNSDDVFNELDSVLHDVRALRNVPSHTESAVDAISRVYLLAHPRMLRASQEVNQKMGATAIRLDLSRQILDVLRAFERIAAEARVLMDERKTEIAKPAPATSDQAFQCYIASLVYRGRINVGFLRSFPATEEGMKHAIEHAQTVAAQEGGAPAVYEVHRNEKNKRLRVARKEKK